MKCRKARRALVAVGMSLALALGWTTVADAPQAAAAADASSAAPGALCFETTQDIPLTVTGAGQAGIRRRDLNGDGLDDVVVAGSSSTGVGGFDVLLNTDQGFTDPSVFLSGRDIHDITIADMNVDGRPDIVATSYPDGSVIVLYGDGSGYFGDEVTVLVGGQAGSVVAKDLNGDHYPDIAVLHDDLHHGPAVASIVLSRDGRSFDPPADYSTGQIGSVALSVRDLDRDGRPDLLVANYGPDYGRGSVALRFGRGDGTFANLRLFHAGINPISLVVDDFSEDGRPDFAVGFNNGGQGYQIFLNVGHRAFFPGARHPLQLNPADLAAADFDGDGHDDLAIAAVYGYPGYPAHSPNDVAVLRGRGDGTFYPKPQTFGPHDGGIGVAALSVNGDAARDLAVENGPVSTDPTLSILVNCAGPS